MKHRTLASIPPDTSAPRAQTDGPISLRQARGKMTQLELALLVGCDPSTISGLETQPHEPHVHLALRIARALGLRVEDIAWPEGTRYAPLDSAVRRARANRRRRVVPPLEVRPEVTDTVA